MITGAPSALLTLSVDLELDIEQQGHDGDLETLTTRLLEMLQGRGLGATWAVADPALSAATQQILAAGTGHEMAVLGDRTWVGNGAGRQRFARELSRRVLGARAAGLTVSTLALRKANLDEHLDLLVKMGISVVRAGCGAPDEPRHTRSSWTRQGVYEATADVWLPSARRWFKFVDTWSARRKLETTIRNQDSIHLVLDAARMVHGDGADLGTIESILNHAVRRRDQGELRILPLRDLNATQRPESATAPLHSILRPAA